MHVLVESVHGDDGVADERGAVPRGGLLSALGPVLLIGGGDVLRRGDAGEDVEEDEQLVPAPP